MQNMIHRDLKPENFLLDHGDNLQLADFGLSIRSGGPHRARYTLCGTADYLAPEMLRNEPYTTSVDVWSVGVLAYEFVTGKNPFRVGGRPHQPQDQPEEEVQQCDGIYGLQQQLRERILAGEITFPPGVSDDAKDFIAKVLYSTHLSRCALSLQGPLTQFARFLCCSLLRLMSSSFVWIHQTGSRCRKPSSMLGSPSSRPNDPHVLWAHRLVA